VRACLESIRRLEALSWLSDSHLKPTLCATDILTTDNVNT
jgi:hypothetical protein